MYNTREQRRNGEAGAGEIGQFEPSLHPAGLGQQRGKSSERVGSHWDNKRLKEPTGEKRVKSASVPSRNRICPSSESALSAEEGRELN